MRSWPRVRGFRSSRGGTGLAWALPLTALLLAVPLAHPQGEPRKLVMVAGIEGMIDLGLVPFVERVLRQAADQGAAAVVLQVNTFGGRVDAAVAIRDPLLRSRVTTVAFVNKRAISAGALISLAAEKLVMAEGATIGAATPVQMGPSEVGGAVQEKTVSYVRKEFRATADARKRPGLIAEAMVDSDVEIEGVVAKGKLLTLTSEEALRLGVADARADDLAQLLTVLGLDGAEVRHESVNWAEQIVRFLTHPVISSLLMTLAMLGLVVELRTPGFGLPGLVGLASLAAFFWGHWLVRLVGFEEILLLTVGLVLVALEVFVLPGFGVAGVLGALAIVAGLTLSLFGAGAPPYAFVEAGARVAISLLLALGGALALLRFLPRLPGGGGLVLEGALPGGEPSRPPHEPVDLLGAAGVALTPLRPAGVAIFAERPVDVVTEGGFIEAGQAVKVVQVAGHRVVVRRQGVEAGEEGRS